MPEYLAPGVYVEEVSYRSKSIEGVSTTTTGFVGPTRYGPVDLERRLAELTASGILTASPNERPAFRPLARRPGALKRFLADRDE